MRPIDADSMKAEVESLDAESNNSTYESAMKDMLRFFITLIDNQTTIKPEVRRGKWIEETEPDENGNVIAMCNQCYHTDEHCKNIKIPYCWYCGAKMDVTEMSVGNGGIQE